MRGVRVDSRVNGSGPRVDKAGMRRFAIALAASLLWLGPAQASKNDFAVPAGARSRGIVVDGEPKVTARLLVDVERIRPGDAFSVGVLFDLARGWHIYWRNPGDAGLPTRIAWSLDGASHAALHWPAPEVFDEGDGLLTTYGYADQVLLFVPARLSSSATGALEVVARVDYLACQNECIPGEARLRRRVPVGVETVAAADSVLEIFQRYGERVPVPADALDLDVQVLYSQSRIRPNDEFRAAIAVVACMDHSDLPHECPSVRPGRREREAVFVPAEIAGVEFEITDSRAHPRLPTGWLVTLKGRANAKDPGADQRLAGVLALKRGDGSRIWVELDETLPRERAGAEVASIDHLWLEPRAHAGRAPPGLPFGRALALALIGGLILNLMPCVLPVLAIKVFGVAALAHEGRRTVLMHGLTYTFGCIVTLLLLAGAVVGLKTAGTAVGWGFQFQEPLFVVALSVVLLVFALSFFGVFEIYSQGGRLGRLGDQAVGLRRSFFDGLLAVVVATPCSAPFLGTAVGFALASSVPVILAVFATIGLGLALPYVLVTLIPGWARVIPRPGPWMQTVRALLGFGLLATVVWLVWLMGSSFGIEGMTALLAFLLAVAAATWLYGASQSASRPGKLLRLGLAALLVASTGSAGLRLDARRGGAEPDAHAGIRDWKPFDPEEIAAVLASGRTAFVDFTADWCITCGVNERLVLESTVVTHEIERLNVATFKADWTRRDERIRAELARYGRAGVPMYLVYSPSAPQDPQVLPELLTIDLVVNALRKAARENGVQTTSSEPSLAPHAEKM